MANNANPFDWGTIRKEIADAAAPFASMTGMAQSAAHTEEHVDTAAKDTSAAAKSTERAANTVRRAVVAVAVAAGVGIVVALTLVATSKK